MLSWTVGYNAFAFFATRIKVCGRYSTRELGVFMEMYLPESRYL